MLRLPEACFLCGRPPVAVGVWTGTNARQQSTIARVADELGLPRPPAGKRIGGLVYALCEICFEYPDRAERVEAACCAMADVEPERG